MPLKRKGSGSPFAWIFLAIILCLPAAQCRALPAPPAPPLPATPAGQPVQVALLSPASGELATVGRRLRNGIVLAFDAQNLEGGVQGRPLVWRNYDAGCDFETARQATGQAIADGFEFIIGPLCSEGAIAAAEVAQARQALLLAPAATHPLVTVDGQGQTRPTVFRVSYVYPWQGRAAAQFAREELSVGKAAVIYQAGDDYGSSLAQAFAQTFTGLGGTVVAQAGYPAGAPDFERLLATVDRAGAEVLYLPVPVVAVNQIAPLAAPLGLTLLGSDSWESEALDRLAVAGSYYTRHFTAADDRPQVQEWTETYRASFAIEPDPLAALGYDAARLLIQALQHSDNLELATVIRALEQIRFEGVTGPFTFDNRHNPIKPVPILQVEPETTRFIDSLQP